MYSRQSAQASLKKTSTPAPESASAPATTAPCGSSVPSPSAAPSSVPTPRTSMITSGRSGSSVARKTACRNSPAVGIRAWSIVTVSVVEPPAAITVSLASALVQPHEVLMPTIRSGAPPRLSTCTAATARPSTGMLPTSTAAGRTAACGPSGAPADRPCHHQVSAAVVPTATAAATSHHPRRQRSGRGVTSATPFNAAG
jgi:hypothetical protein